MMKYYFFKELDCMIFGMRRKKKSKKYAKEKGFSV
jgi:hypothetical protein